MLWTVYFIIMLDNDEDFVDSLTSSEYAIYSRGFHAGEEYKERQFSTSCVDGIMVWEDGWKINISPMTADSGLKPKQYKDGQPVKILIFKQHL